jgi:hypothetical protein
MNFIIYPEDGLKLLITEGFFKILQYLRTQIISKILDYFSHLNLSLDTVL